MEPSTQTRTPETSEALRKRGNAHLQSGELEAAAECYRKAVAADPADAAAHVNLGYALRELQLPADAERALLQAIALDPNVGDAHYLMGTLANAKNEPDEAIRHFNRALEVQPDMEVAYRDLYALLFRTGQVAKAKDVVARAIALWPGAADLRCYLGYLLGQQEEFAAAATCYQQALAISPDVPEAHNDLGCVLEKLGRVDDAVSSYNRALALRPGYVDALVNLGNVSSRRGKLDEACEFHERAIASDPSRPEGYTNLGTVLQMQGKPEEALRCYQEVMRLRPTDSARHLVAALSGANPDQAPTQYVERLFDGFADTFETQLVTVLKYDVPRVLAGVVEEIAKPRPGQWDILDLGCGTGLAGEAFALYARKLVGVDLSPRMLAKAATRNVYQRLENLDLLAAMQGEGTSTYDLLIAADVFVYVGKLDPLMEEAKRLLRPGGLIGFSVEDIELPSGEGVNQVEMPDFYLKLTARYGHSTEYLQRLASACGFDIRHMSPAQIRLERGKPIRGHIAVWARAEAGS